MDFREAHAYLRGYSDRLEDKPRENLAWADYQRNYDKGYDNAELFIEAVTAVAEKRPV